MFKLKFSNKTKANILNSNILLNAEYIYWINLKLNNDFFNTPDKRFLLKSGLNH